MSRVRGSHATLCILYASGAVYLACWVALITFPLSWHGGIAEVLFLPSVVFMLPPCHPIIEHHFGLAVRWDAIPEDAGPGILMYFAWQAGASYTAGACLLGLAMKAVMREDAP